MARRHDPCNMPNAFSKQRRFAALFALAAASFLFGVAQIAYGLYEYFTVFKNPPRALTANEALLFRSGELLATQAIPWSGVWFGVFSLIVLAHLWRLRREGTC